MIGKGATPSFFAIANYNYTLTLVPTYLLYVITASFISFSISQEITLFRRIHHLRRSHPRHLLIRPSAIPRRDFYVTGNFGEIFCQKTSEKSLSDFPEVFYYMNVQNQSTPCYLEIPKHISKNIKAMVILFFTNTAITTIHT